ncbi:MAG: hypothetical protein HC879_15475 [Leptolyngbyaceae cyanobacterium SL_5_9]|nr:hypothetical protein [Leptolyngbyaceae cyanobacterium SL_5_9]
MHSLNRNFENNRQWQSYRQLELLSDLTPAPVSSRISLGISFLWRSLLSILVDELVEEQRVEYLERCWRADQTHSGNPVRHPWQQFLTLIE